MAEVQLVIKAIDQASSSLKSIEKTVSDSANQMSSAFSSLNRVAGLFGVAIGSYAVVSFFKGAANAALEAEKASNVLKQSVIGLGLNYGQQSSRIEQAVQAASKYAHVQDTEVANALNRLILQTGNLDISLNSLNRVFDLARRAQVDVFTAILMHTRGLEGQLEALGRYFPKLRAVNEQLGEHASQSQKAAAYIRFLQDNVDGASNSIGKQEAAINDLNIAWNKFSETVGKLTAPIITGTLNFLTDVIKDLSSGFNSLNKEIDEISGTLGRGASGSWGEPIKKGAKDASDSFIDLAKHADLVRENLRMLDVYNKSLKVSEDDFSQAYKKGGIFLERYNELLDQGFDSAHAFLIATEEEQHQIELANSILASGKIIGEEYAKVIELGGFAWDTLVDKLKDGVEPLEAISYAMDSVNDGFEQATAILTKAKSSVNFREIFSGIEESINDQLKLKTVIMDVANASQTAVSAFILGQQKLGPALRQGIAQVLAAKGAEAAVLAVIELGWAFADLALGKPTAAAHFTSAAYYAAGAAAAGVAARALAGGAFKGGGPGGLAMTPLGGANAAQAVESTRQVVINQQIVYQGVMSVDESTKDRIVNELNDAMGRMLESNGGRTGNLQLVVNRV